MDIEKNIIGNILIGNTEDISRLLPEDFTEFPRVISAIIELYANNLLFNGEQPDMPEIARKSNASLVDIAEFVTYAEPLQYQAALQILFHRSKKQILIECMNEQIDVDQIMDRLSKFEARINNGAKQNTVHFFEKAMDTFDKRSKEKIKLIHTGFRPLDGYLEYIKAGDLIVVSARPSTGKTAFMSQLARNMAAKQYKVLYFSLEVSGVAIAERFIRSDAGDSVKRESLQTGHLTPKEREYINLTWDSTKNLDVIDDDCWRLSEIQRTIQNRKPDIVFVDQLSLIQLDTSRYLTDFERFTYITKALKRLAMSLQIPVFLAAQIKRDPNGKEDAIPTLSSLKGSGSIEEDADIVIQLHKLSPAQFADSASFAYGKGEEFQQNGFRPILMIVAKNRESRTGQTDILYQGSRFRFIEIPQPQEVL